MGLSSEYNGGLSETPPPATVPLWTERGSAPAWFTLGKAWSLAVLGSEPALATYLLAVRS